MQNLESGRRPLNALLARTTVPEVALLPIVHVRKMKRTFLASLVLLRKDTWAVFLVILNIWLHQLNLIQNMGYVYAHVILRALLVRIVTYIFDICVIKRISGT